MSFIKKLKLYQNNLYRQEYLQFPSLQQLKESSHIDALIEDMIARFKDLQEPAWIINQLLSDVESIIPNLKEQFIDI